jgi:hypothetical protein
MPRLTIHESITADRISEAVERHRTTLDNPGFCVRCGADAEGVEPDARGYTCESCGEDGVYGAEELLMMTVL